MSKRRGKNGKNKGNKPTYKNHEQKSQTVQKNNLQLNKRPYDFTPKQISILESIEYPYEHLTLLGFAGTAKTSTALFGALRELDQGNYQKVILVRSAVQSRDIGHLPGNELEKGQVYEKPFMSLVNDFYNRDDAYGILKKTGLIQFELTSFLRGETFDNSIIVVDEAQNMEASELATVITRIGVNSKIIICGDILQRDLKRNNEKTVEKTLDILHSMDSFVNFYMTEDDIVRSSLVKEFIIKQNQMYPDGL